MPRNIRTPSPNPRRLTIIKHVLDSIPYGSAPREKIVLPKRRKRGDYKESRYPFRFSRKLLIVPAGIDLAWAGMLRRRMGQ
jgi:hypothetical protein